MRVSVLIPTFRRPESFRRAVQSAFAQQGVGSFEVIAIDNSPEGAALSLFKELAEAAPVPFRFAHQPAPGVANARNAALALATGDYVAWLDDDQEASLHWLASLLEARRITGAQSVFGPVRAVAPADSERRNLVEEIYTRNGPAKTQIVSRAYGVGNSLQPRSMFEGGDFDPRANETGGEDDALFASWTRAGALFAWAAEADVVEHIEPHRASMRHVLKRAFAYGQGPCETAWAEGDIVALAKHMTAGAAQAPAFGLTALVSAIVSGPNTDFFLDRAVRGSGKLFWFLEQRFYGAALARSAR